MSNCNKQHHILCDSFIKQGWEHFQEWGIDVTHIFTTQFLGEAIRVRLPCLPAPGGTLHAPLPPTAWSQEGCQRASLFVRKKRCTLAKQNKPPLSSPQTLKTFPTVTFSELLLWASDLNMWQMENKEFQMITVISQNRCKTFWGARL